MGMVCCLWVFDCCLEELALLIVHYSKTSCLRSVLATVETHVLCSVLSTVKPLINVQ